MFFKKTKPQSGPAQAPSSRDVANEKLVTTPAGTHAPLDVAELRRVVDPARLEFETTADLEPGGLGLYLGVELVSDQDTQTPAADEAAYICNRMKDYGFLISTDGPLHNVLKIKPPLVFSIENARQVCAALDEILHSGITLEERMMLRAKLLDEQGAAVGPALFALNEVVIVKGSTEPMMRLGCWADREYITTYKADGLIVSTPTGSTAYNLSAGGPIAHAELQTLLVTPICPFMLDSRPVLLSPRTRVTAQLAPPSTNVKIMVDGRLGWTMRANDFLSIEAAGKPLRLISSPHKGYFDILRNKLNWGGRDPGYPLPEVIMA